MARGDAAGTGSSYRKPLVHFNLRGRSSLDRTEGATQASRPDEIFGAFLEDLTDRRLWEMNLLPSCVGRPPGRFISHRLPVVE